MCAAFQRVVLSRLWLTFVVLGISLFAFGAGTVNLGLLLMANSRLLAQYGWQAVMDGALRQTIELLLTGYPASPPTWCSRPASTGSRTGWALRIVGSRT